MNNLPKMIKIAAVLEIIGTISLISSLAVSTPPAFLLTLGLGGGCIFLGALFFLFSVLKL